MPFKDLSFKLGAEFLTFMSSPSWQVRYIPIPPAVFAPIYCTLLLLNSCGSGLDFLWDSDILGCLELKCPHNVTWQSPLKATSMTGPCLSPMFEPEQLGQVFPLLSYSR